MDANFWKDTLINNLAVPLILVAFGILIAIAQHYANKFVEMFTERQKVESVEKIANARARLIAEIDKSTEGAVASTMDMVDKMKEGGKKLTEEQIAEITNSAKAMIHLTIPKMIGDIPADEILGGSSVVEEIINVSLEKYVLEYKIKRANSGMTPAATQPVTTPTAESADCTDICETVTDEGTSSIPMVYTIPEEEPSMDSQMEDVEATNDYDELQEEDPVTDEIGNDEVPDQTPMEEYQEEPEQQTAVEESTGIYVAPPLTDVGGRTLI